MKNRSLVLTVSLIAMMIVGVAHGAQIASTDYVTKSVGDEADLVWTAIDSINNETTGILATAKSYTDGEITSAMEEVTDAIPTNNNQLTNGAGYITAASLPTKVSDLTNDTGFITAASLPTVDAALSDASTNAVQNKVVTAALDGKLGKNEKAASAATADSATTAGSATSATQDASGNVITETYATKGELSSGLSGKLDTTGSIAISQVNGLSDALAQAGSQLNEAQTAAVNSGITQAKVDAYDAYAGQIASKADASALSDYATNRALTDGLAEKLGKNEKAASATTADSATTATKATQDASGNVITETYATKTELGGKMDKVTLATVATSGSYNDLSGLPTIPTNNNQLTNGAGYITAADIPAAPTVDDALSSTSTNAVQNKVVTAALDGKLGKNEKAASATTADSATTAGSATSAIQDASGNVITETYALKTAIPTNNNQLTNGAGYITAASLPTVDAALSDTSANAVQNKVVTAALNGKMDKVTLATVATSGSYNDLSGLPTIPTNNNQLTNGAGYITAASLPTVDAALSDTSTNAVQNKVVSAALNGKMDKVTLATVATSGLYSDLSGLPTIPTNNNQLTNGANYITAASLPGAASASAAGIMKWGQIPSGSATATTSATIWVQ